MKKYLETACQLINYIYTKDCPDKTAKPGDEQDVLMSSSAQGCALR